MRQYNARIRYLFCIYILLFIYYMLFDVQSVSAQSGTVILPLREMSVGQAFECLRKQTEYVIEMERNQLNQDKIVFFPAQQLEVVGLLRMCLAESGFTWETKGRRIVIIPISREVESDVRSAMDRSGFHSSQMTFVPDPWSRTQRPFEDMFNVRRSYWDADGTGETSLSMVTINYRVNNSIVVKDYMGNAQALEVIRRSLTNKEVLETLDYIVITAGSSPEGNTVANEQLASKRALAMKSYLMWQYPYLDRDIIYTFSMGEDWTGLRKMVVEDQYTPYRDQVLSVLDAQVNAETRRTMLKKIGGGKAYQYITLHMLPRLRGAVMATLHFKEECLEKVIETHRIDTVYLEKIIEKETIVIQDTELEVHPLFAIKTNLFFDLASAINVELEVPLGRRWSIAGEWIFPWWLYEKKQYAFQLGNGNIELKYWLGNRNIKDQLTGWFVGIYGGAGYYDFEWKDEGKQGEFWHAGFSGGYAHSINKKGNWRMEYSVGLGYLDGKYREYIPKMKDDDKWHLIRQGKGRNSWVGPTRAKVSLVWMIKHGYRKKGGRK